MTSLLHIASRVEAAVEAYISVRDFVDREEWKKRFHGEKKAAIREFQRGLRDNKGTPPSLHPTLVALTIVLGEDEDLARITRSHPDRERHEFYSASAEFPSDISGLLPPSEDRWWESLAKAARTAHAGETAPHSAPAVRAGEATPQVAPAVHASGTTPSQAPFPLQRRVKIVFKKNPPNPEGNKDVPMEVDEAPEGSQSRGRPKAPKAAASSRKRKGSSTAPRGTAKRRAQSGQHPDSAEQSSGGSNAEQGEEHVFQCRRCMDAGETCNPPPDGPCERCKSKKLGCSLMPPNPATGKTDRRTLSVAWIREFRIKQAEEALAETRRGKRRLQHSPDVGRPAGSDPSALAPLAGLGSLTLDSGGSSAANTPADSPALSEQPQLPERPAPAASSAPAPPPASAAPSAPAPSSTPKAHPSKSSAGFVVEVPRASKQLRAARRQASHSRHEASPESDVGSNSARIAALESKQDELERWRGNVDRMLSDFDRRLKDLGV